MTIEELYKGYADRQISRIYPDLDNTNPNLPRESKMSFNVFSGHDIELAVEFGAKSVANEIKAEIQRRIDLFRKDGKLGSDTEIVLYGIINHIGYMEEVELKQE
jgi:hypothetical protein